MNRRSFLKRSITALGLAVAIPLMPGVGRAEGAELSGAVLSVGRSPAVVGIKHPFPVGARLTIKGWPGEYRVIYRECEWVTARLIDPGIYSYEKA